MMNVLNLNFLLGYRQINGEKEKNLPFGIDTLFQIHLTPALAIKLNQKKKKSLIVFLFKKKFLIINFNWMIITLEYCDGFFLTSIFDVKILIKPICIYVRIIPIIINYYANYYTRILPIGM